MPAHLWLLSRGRACSPFVLAFQHPQRTLSLLGRQDPLPGRQIALGFKICTNLYNSKLMLKN